MKILIILKKWPGGVGGGVKNIMYELKNQGHVVEAVSREEDLKIYSFLGSIIPIRSLVKSKLKKEKFDIIYTQDWSIAFPLLVPFPIYKKRHFCMFHGNQQGMMKLFQELVGKIMGKSLLCMAPSLKRRFPQANINYCGVNLSQFHSLNKKREFLGWIQKGTEVLSLEEVKEISKGADLPLLVAKNFTHEEMNSKFYSKCKVFISFPPKSAGFQASWLEAMAADVPIILGNNNGAGEIQPFDKIENAHDLSCIINKIKNPSKKNYLKWIKENDFTWKRHASELIKIFNNK